MVILTTANSAGNGISVLLGNGDGTFQPSIAIGTGLSPVSIAVGDLNGDGQLDLAISNFNSDNISVLLGNGDGTFQAQTVYPVGSRPTSINIGDFNGDGNLDLVTTNWASSNLSVLLGNGDGTFQASTFYATDSYPDQVSVADLDGDGKDDLVTIHSYPNDTQANEVSVIIGNGDGTFRTPATYATGSFPGALSVADFDGDGNLDIATADATTGEGISILLGMGGGAFQTAIEYAANSGPDGPASLTIGDFNGDGKPDLASASGTSVRILLGEQIATYDFNGISLPFTGSQNLRAVYSGDGSRSGGQSNIISLMGLVASTITLTSSQPSLVIGQTDLLTAKVPSGASGSVSFTAGGALLGNVAIDSTGTASLSTQFAGLSVGTFVITATYSGDSSFAGSSTSMTQTLSLANSAVLVSSSSDPSSFGNLVTFTATLASGATGTITFTDGAVIIGTKVVNGGTAAISVSSLSAGSHAIGAMYSGDSNYAAAASPKFTQIVNKALANVTLTSSGNPSIYGDRVTITATVTPGATGTVTFADGTTILGVANLDISGRASIASASFAAGSHNIVATYSGDANYL
jgi:hypothetical protein